MRHCSIVSRAIAATLLVVLASTSANAATVFFCSSHSLYKKINAVLPGGSYCDPLNPNVCFSSTSVYPALYVGYYTSISNSYFHYEYDALGYVHVYRVWCTGGTDIDWSY